MTTVAAGPQVLSRVWSATAVVADNLHGPEIAGRLRADDDVSAWGVVSRTDEDEIGRVVEAFGLDEVVLADLTSHDRRVKYEELGDVRLLTTRTARLHGQTLVTASMSLLITPRLLLIFADDRERTEIGARLVAVHERLADGGAERAAQFVMHGLVGGYAEVISEVESESDDLADAMFGGRPLSREEKLQAFRQRRIVTELRRITEPMREIVEDLAQSSNEVPGGISRSWNLLIEHQSRIANAADDMRDSLGAIFDTSLALDSTRMDEVMKKLTGWAAIVAAPTLITGFVGMNVPFWLNGSGTGFVVYLAIMVVAVVVLFIVMRRKNWI